MTAHFYEAQRHWHQRRHIAPKVERSEVPPAASYPLLRAPDILDHHRDVMARGFARFALDAEACIEQLVIRRWQRLRPLPRHRAVAVCLTRRARHDQRRILE